MHGVYFLLLACCSLFDRLLAERRDSSRGSLLTSFAAALVVCATVFGTQEDLGTATRPTTVDSDVMTAYNYLKKHPGEAYFPTETLAHLESEGKHYHFEYGVYDRWLAGFPVSQSHFESHIPPHCDLICFPPDSRTLVSAKVFIERHLSDYQLSAPMPELPGWWCYRKKKSAVSGHTGE